MSCGTDGKPMSPHKVARRIADSRPNSGVTDSISSILFWPDGAIAVVEQTAIQLSRSTGSPVKTLPLKSRLRAERGMRSGGRVTASG